MNISETTYHGMLQLFFMYTPKTLYGTFSTYVLHTHQAYHCVLDPATIFYVHPLGNYPWYFFYIGSTYTSSLPLCTWPCNYFLCTHPWKLLVVFLHTHQAYHQVCGPSAVPLRTADFYPVINSSSWNFKF